jgi:hypothetical protein
VGDKVVTKAGTPVLAAAAGGPPVAIDAEQPKYVCRAGLKLEKALAHWGIDVRCGVTEAGLPARRYKSGPGPVASRGEGCRRGWCSGQPSVPTDTTFQGRPSLQPRRLSRCKVEGLAGAGLVSTASRWGRAGLSAVAGPVASSLHAAQVRGMDFDA